MKYFFPVWFVFLGFVLYGLKATKTVEKFVLWPYEDSIVYPVDKESTEDHVLLEGNQVEDNVFSKPATVFVVENSWFTGYPTLGIHLDGIYNKSIYIIGSIKGTNGEKLIIYDPKNGSYFVVKSNTVIQEYRI